MGKLQRMRSSKRHREPVNKTNYNFTFFDDLRFPANFFVYLFYQHFLEIEISSFQRSTKLVKSCRKSSLSEIFFSTPKNGPAK